MIWLILAVVLLSLVLLTVAFRSIVIAVKAAVLNLLSVGAAYGVVIAVFQFGWGSGLLGLDEKVPIPAFVPMLMFAIVFGLSMDYEVFLLSRVHEVWVRTGDAHRSVAIGIGSTARVITTAAAIMVVVFSSFVLDSDPTIKMLAVGMAVAVLIDASLVRMVLVPALMSILDRRAWWLPAWLDRIIPDLELEGGEESEPTGRPCPRPRRCWRRQRITTGRTRGPSSGVRRSRRRRNNRRPSRRPSPAPAQLSFCRISSRTVFASAWPRVAFITAPTSAPAAATLPARIFSATSGWAAIASSTAAARASTSDTRRSPRSATTVSTSAPVSSTPSTACRASPTDSVPSSTSATTRATCSGLIARSAGSISAALAFWAR